jgi:transcriptional regulator with XRE-family HTH domain
MATIKDWLNQKFVEWEKKQGGRQSYYAFARYLEVSQSGLSAWMTGGGVPGGDDLIALAAKLGPEVYDVLGLPRPSAEIQQVTVSFASLPPDLRQRLSSAIVEVDQTLRQQRLRPEDAAARPIVLAVLRKWGFQYKSE